MYCSLYIWLMGEIKRKYFCIVLQVSQVTSLRQCCAPWWWDTHTSILKTSAQLVEGFITRVLTTGPSVHELLIHRLSDITVKMSHSWTYSSVQQSWMMRLSDRVRLMLATVRNIHVVMLAGWRVISVIDNRSSYWLWLVIMIINTRGEGKQKFYKPLNLKPAVQFQAKLEVFVISNSEAMKRSWV